MGHILYRVQFVFVFAQPSFGVVEMELTRSTVHPQLVPILNITCMMSFHLTSVVLPAGNLSQSDNKRQNKKKR